MSRAWRRADPRHWGPRFIPTLGENPRRNKAHSSVAQTRCGESLSARRTGGKHDREGSSWPNQWAGEGKQGRRGGSANAQQQRGWRRRARDVVSICGRRPRIEGETTRCETTGCESETGERELWGALARRGGAQKIHGRAVDSHGLQPVIDVHLPPSNYTLSAASVVIAAAAAAAAADAARLEVVQRHGRRGRAEQRKSAVAVLAGDGGLVGGDGAREAGAAGGGLTQRAAAQGRRRRAARRAAGERDERAGHDGGGQAVGGCVPRGLFPGKACHPGGLPPVLFPILVARR